MTDADDCPPPAVAGAADGPTARRALVVDDSRLARMALRAALLEIWGQAEIEEGADAAAGLALAADRRFDVVLIDYNMPGMDGLTAAGLLRARDPAPPVALVTANAQDAIVWEAWQIGVPVIQKPVRRDELDRALRTIMGPASC